MQFHRETTKQWNWVNVPSFQEVFGGFRIQIKRRKRHSNDSNGHGRMSHMLFVKICRLEEGRSFCSSAHSAYYIYWRVRTKRYAKDSETAILGESKLGSKG